MPRPSDPNALRRTGKHVHLLLPADEHEAYQQDAQDAGVSLAEHIRQLLKAAHKRSRRTGGQGIRTRMPRSGQTKRND